MRYSEHALHLLSMTSGLPHPAAENPIIIHRRKCRPISLFGDYSISITDSRLAILVGPPLPPNGMDIVVWDWRTGCVLLVRESLASVTASYPTKLLLLRRTTEAWATGNWDSWMNIRSQCSRILIEGILHDCKFSTRNGGRSRNLRGPHFPSRPLTWTLTLCIYRRNRVATSHRMISRLHPSTRILLSAYLPYILASVVRVMQSTWSYCSDSRESERVRISGGKNGGLIPSRFQSEGWISSRIPGSLGVDYFASCPTACMATLYATCRYMTSVMQVVSSTCTRWIGQAKAEGRGGFHRAYMDISSPGAFLICGMQPPDLTAFCSAS